MVRNLTQVGSKGHDFEYLKSRMKDPPINCVFPKPLIAWFRSVVEWSTDLRYEVGFVEYNRAEAFLEAARNIRDWAERM
jgi:hypothetical protein